MTTQLTLAVTIGLGSFIFFCFARKVDKWKVTYSPRTLLKGELHSLLSAALPVYLPHFGSTPNCGAEARSGPAIRDGISLD